MVIRYKYYPDWNSLDYWELTYFWKPHWWLAYLASVVSLIGGGILIGLFSNEVKK